jgi:tRNA modification GTPase
MLFDRINFTICALATTPGSSIGIIRISGKEAFKIASLMCSVKHLEHMSARLVKIKKAGSVLEECLLLPFKAPNSFTGEDVVEFHTHGSMENCNQVISFALSLGAVPAAKGEFSFRAVMNGKMDVGKAVALNTLISSSNPLATELSRKAAFEDRSVKKLSSLLKEWDYFFILSTAIVDFPDQVESEMPLGALEDLIFRTEKEISSILNNSQMLKKALGFSLMIIGRPNVGKSSLFNVLIKKERAIVSDTAGTTRDYITDSLFIKGFPVNIIDSAGIREGGSEIEKTGIEKSRNLFSTADLLLLVLDGSVDLSDEDNKIILETSIYPRIFAINKSDLGSDKIHFDLPGEKINISCQNNTGIDILENMIYERIKFFFPDPSEMIFFSHWQIEVANSLINNLLELRSYINSDQAEILNVLIKDIYENIGDLSGNISSHSVYDKIFSGFCLGK